MMKKSARPKRSHRYPWRTEKGALAQRVVNTTQLRLKLHIEVV